MKSVLITGANKPVRSPTPTSSPAASKSACCGSTCRDALGRDAFRRREGLRLRHRRRPGSAGVLPEHARSQHPTDLTVGHHQEAQLHPPIGGRSTGRGRRSPGPDGRGGPAAVGSPLAARPARSRRSSRSARRRRGRALHQLVVAAEVERAHRLGEGVGLRRDRRQDAADVGHPVQHAPARRPLRGLPGLPQGGRGRVGALLQPDRVDDLLGRTGRGGPGSAPGRRS